MARYANLTSDAHKLLGLTCVGLPTRNVDLVNHDRVDVVEQALGLGHSVGDLRLLPRIRHRARFLVTTIDWVSHLQQTNKNPAGLILGHQGAQLACTIGLNSKEAIR